MRKFLTLVLLVLVSALGWAKGEVSWKVLRIEGSTEVGGKANIVVQAIIQEGWHLYSVLDQTKPDDIGPFPTTFEGEELKVAESSDIAEAILIREMDKGFKKDINFFRGTGTYWVPVTFTSGLDKAKLKVTFMVCNNGTCIPPQPADLDLKSASVSKVSTKPAAGSMVPQPGNNAPPKVAENKTDDGEVNRLNEAKKKGLIAFILLAMGGGFAALLTPCVFPMIPITVSFFSKKKKDGESPLTGALLYCAGIIGTFTVLGVAVSAISGATGLTRFANNAWVNLALAIIFIVLALSLFGVFEIGLPSKFVNKFDSTGKSSFVAPIMMGLTFSLTSFTCTLPFVGAVLFGASQKEFFYPFVGMLAFSSAFCLPFFLLALFPQALSKLPKSGAWMVTVKAYMGFIELIAAVKFLSSFELNYSLGILTREVTLAIWVGILSIAAIYLFGWIRLPKVHDGKPGLLRIGFGVGTLVLAVWVGSALSGHSIGNLVGFLPPSPYPGKETGVTEGWKKEFASSWEDAKTRAKKNGKPIFIDFTGIFCTNCRVMENEVFPNEKVQAEFKKFNLVSLYTDRVQDSKHKAEDLANSALQQKLLQSVTLPAYVVVTPDGETRVSSREFTPNPAEFAAWLEANSK